MARPHGPDGVLVLAGRARDLVTTAGGQARATANARVNAHVDRDGRVRRLSTFPVDSRVRGLLNRPVRAGFRTAVGTILPEHRAAGTPLHLLLDELPVATLISGFAVRHLARDPAPDRPSPTPQLDVCAGWRRGGSAHRALSEHGWAPRTPGPPAPDLAAERDRVAWHSTPSLKVAEMRRRRLIDVVPGPRLDVYAMFRDSYVDLEGTERVLHEFDVTAVVDPGAFVVEDITVSPRVAPYGECVLGAASADRVRGRAAGTLREYVAIDLWGPTSCTHLNDLLRSLADIPHLARDSANVLAAR
jgi:hypothetical protein